MSGEESAASQIANAKFDDLPWENIDSLPTFANEYNKSLDKEVYEEFTSYIILDQR